MKKVDFTKAGGFPLKQDTLKFMQDAYNKEFLAAFLQWITTVGVFDQSGGVAQILTGVTVRDSEVTPGWIVRNKELLYFAGDTLTNVENSNGIGVQTITTPATFKDNSVQGVYEEKFAVAGGVDPIPLANFRRIINLTDLRPIVSKKVREEVPTLNAGSKTNITLTVAGASVGDVVVVSLEDVAPPGFPTPSYGVTDWVSVRARVVSPDQVLVTLINQHQSSPAFDGWVDFRVRIIK